jgi:hypothetical protein
MLTFHFARVIIMLIESRRDFRNEAFIEKLRGAAQWRLQKNDWVIAKCKNRKMWITQKNH